MAGQNQITWENKVNTKTIDVPRINKVIDDDMNEIKQKHNDLDNLVDQALSNYSESNLVSTLAPLKFDLDYQVGSSLTPISGNITFDISDATPGSACSVFHQDGSAPTLGNNVKLVLVGFTLADYGVSELNEFVFHYMEDPQNSDEPYLKVYHSKNITVIPSI